MSLTKIKSSNITTTGVTAGSYTAADITVNSSGQVTSASSGTGGGGATVTILSVIVTSDTYANLDDTAVDISGGYIKIIGTGFASGCTVLVNNIPATSTTFIGPTEVRAQLPATAAGTYVLYVVNANGSVAIRVNGITFSATPSWINSSDLSSYPVNEAISIQLSATSATTYALQSGSSLPAGLTLSSSGLLSGTVTGLENDTSYSFAIIATDAELQDSPRTFTITIVVQVQVSRSLRFNAPDTTYLSRTFPTAGNRRLWTFSAWYKRSNLTDTGNGLFQYGPDGNNQFRLLLDSSGTITIMDRISAVYIVSMTTTAVFRDPGAWYHIVITYDTAQATAADRVKLYINGTQITSFSTPTYPSQNAEGNVCSASTAYIGRGDTTSVYYYSGYLTEVQLVDGQALTPTAFALTNTTTGQYGPRKYMGSYGTNGFYLPFTDNSSVLNLGRNYEPLTADPLWPQTVLLLNGTGTNNANNNTFTDSSTNAFAITRNGNTTQGTFSPFSQTGWGNYFDGTNDSLTVSSNAAFGFGTGDFCVEFWMYPTALTSARGIYLTNVTNGIYLYTDTSNKLIVRSAAAANLITSNDAISLNTWTHVAVCRTGTTLSLYLNGSRTAGGTAVNSTNFAAGDLYIGVEISSFYYSGYLGSLRVVKGSAVYDPTALTITVPTAPLSAVSGTSLLTCQYNRFRDASPNNFTITANNGVAVQAFSPFNPTASWSAATHGGSGYFDGSGDYLTVPDNASLELGSSSFTIQAWVYVTGLPSSGNLKGIFAKSGSPYGGFYFCINSSGVIKLYASTTGSTWDIANDVGTSTAPLNAWTHIALSRSGSNWRIWVNGASGGTVTSSATIWNTTNSWYICSNGSGAENFTGYLSDASFVIGSTVYDPTSSTITVPTAPLTAITNTSLLLNFTNAGIQDATGDNNIETVGDAKISTAQSKWSGGSMAFDGTGDYLYSPSNNLYSFGTGDFTIEAWIYATTLTSKGVFQTSDNPGGLKTTYTSGLVLSTADAANGQLVLNVLGTNITTGSTYIAINTWYHVAVTRLAGNISIFLNGVLAGGPTSIASAINGSYLSVGGYYNTSYLWNGYISDFRITRAARYTGNFTPPTAQFAYNQSDINYKQWVPTNFSVTAGAGNDSVVDTPTNWGVDTGLGGEVRGNYCTLNPLANSGTLSNGNLDYAGSSASHRCRSTFVVSSGKWYWEVTNLNVAGVYVGVVDPAEPLSNEVGAASTGYGIYGSGTKLNNNVSASYAASWLGVGSVIGIALDLDAGTFACYINGVYQGIAYSNLTGPKMPALSQGTNNASVAVSFNFGQRPFAYSAPSGFKALNTHNLPALAVVKSNTAIDTVLYTGNGSTQTVSGLNFSPDLVWIKRRDSNWSNAVYDSIRGAGSLKALSTNATDAEGVFNADTTYGYLSAFNSNGFAVVNGSTGGYTNVNGATYAAWAWDAGTTTVTSTAGTISAQVRANPTAGFSIVTYTGTGANATVGHGLSTAPSMIIVKIRSSSAENWLVYHASLSTPSTAFLYLNSTTAASTLTTYWNGGPTSSVFGLGAYSGINNSTSTYVAYCWATVPGYSAFGSYTGNGSADGPFIYTGFRPRWLLIRRSDTIENWNITDTARDPYNIASLELYPNLTNVEAGSAASYRDFLSNGFKIRGAGGGFNTSGGTYIYAAFAEQPFKYSRAR